MLRYRLNSLLLLTAAIAVTFGFGRIWFQPQRPWEVDRALAKCDALRIHVPKNMSDGAEVIVTFEITSADQIERFRALLDLSSAKEVRSAPPILGGPSLQVVLSEDGMEVANFYLLADLLFAPGYPDDARREYVLVSHDAWNYLLEIGERQAATGGTGGPH